jgi:phospholipase C
MIRKLLALSMSLTLILSGCGQGTVSTPPGNGNANTTPPPPAITPTTAAAAIKHIVVIFGENESFDHYFGTYPNAQNLAGETKFTPLTGTPIPNNYVSNPSLLSNNPNALNLANNVTNSSGTVTSVASGPYRQAPAQAWTGSQSHNYTNEQLAFNQGNMDLFPLSVGAADSAAELSSGGPFRALNATKALTMAYYDGNTVTAMWNYAQHYAINDNSWSSTFGPSSPGAINLISGQTNGVLNPLNLGSNAVADGSGGMTLIGDADPAGDVCSSTSSNASMSGQNVGDLLNRAGVTWGWFEGGFDLGVTNANGTTGCARSSVIVASGSAKATAADYVPHHQPFQYYVTTRNLAHTRPTSPATVGTASDPANHQYDTHDFTDALAAGNLPAVSFLKAPAFQDAHPGNSDPLDEQTFTVNMINALQNSSFWSSTVVIIAYDDSDGWYDHVSSLVNGSATTADTVNGAGVCISTTAATTSSLPGWDGRKNAQGRCGYGMRQPLIVISPWAKKNYLDHTLTDQASVLRFIEDIFASSNRITGSFDGIAGSLLNMFDFSNSASAPNAAKVTLDPTTGVVTSGN